MVASHHDGDSLMMGGVEILVSSPKQLGCLDS